LHIDELITFLKEQDKCVTFIGDAVDKFRNKLSETFSKVHFAPKHLNIVRASALGELGFNLLSQGIQDDIYGSSPIYLRKSQAEREYDKKMGLDKND
jgi:tRNA A37 threonylcarbamoyladenosine modification protein TsaB